jgi:hypothetical protein
VEHETLCHTSNHCGHRNRKQKFKKQKEQHLSISLELHDHVTSDPNIFQNVITGDESWVHGYNPETKIQGSQWKTPISPRPKKTRQPKASVKVMLIVFFDLEADCAVGVHT